MFVLLAETYFFWTILSGPRGLIHNTFHTLI